MENRRKTGGHGVKYCVLIQGRVYTVEIREEGGRRQIFWEGKPLDVEGRIEQINPMTSMLLNGRPFEIFLRREGEYFSIHLDQVEYDVRVTRGLRQGDKSSLFKHGSGHEIIAAPMPGMVVSVKVKPNQEVKIGTPLLILEAMKMENELRSPVTGRVQQVHVEPGRKVEKGEKLLILEK